jgi:Pyruvate/2-oxoacid:ferredoxin oxidoreductase delta subunit
MPSREALGEVTLAEGRAFSIDALFHKRIHWDNRSLVGFRDLDPLYLALRPPAIPPRLTPMDRARACKEINLSLQRDQAAGEAGRCFFCGTCIGCDHCLLLCPEVCILPTNEPQARYRVATDYCKGCGVCASVCPGRVVDMREGA